jgi:hypothetical protein
MLIRSVFIVLFIVLTSVLNSQNLIDWDGNYELQLSDFQSSATEIGGSGVNSLQSSSSVDFSFYMSNAEFMFTKNFNSKVNCSFNRSAAAIVAQDSTTAIDLLHFARYQFDLSELYARKLRKKLFEEKAVLSDVSFFKPLHDEIQNELTERNTVAGKTAELGRNRGELEKLHNEVLREIDQLSDFCKNCKPPKKKK